MTIVNDPLRTDASQWETIVHDIEALAIQRCYEKLNKIVSLGLVDTLREEAARKAIDSRVILDVGCGPGTSTRVIRKVLGSSRIVMLDPSTTMLSIARSEVDGLTIALQGIFERLPLRDSSVDAIIAMFSFRDSIDYELALNEFARVLRSSGKLVILDIFKPSAYIVRLLAKLYLYAMSYIGSILVLCPRSGRYYSAIVKTLDRMYTLEEARSALESRFRRVSVHKGPVIVHTIVAEEPFKP
ncbi:MAG: class I SAM-dependent methyltransferase [Desulfurococcales archaeon]|nr:class I SAM-dependent methyltransferase [Desulfurococcales archaeon]